MTSLLSLTEQTHPDYFISAEPAFSSDGLLM